MTDEPLPVTGEDRQCAAEIVYDNMSGGLRWMHAKSTRDRILAGEWDHHPVVERVARHRLATRQSAEPVMRLADVKAIGASALQSACETDPADPEHPDTICITTADFEVTVRCALENWIESRSAQSLPAAGESDTEHLSGSEGE